MNRAVNLSVILTVSMLGASNILAQDVALIADAESAAPSTVSADATIKNADGTVLREGSNGWTCYPGTDAIGPMCNEPQWDALISALMNKEDLDVTEFSISYMLAGEGDAIGGSNKDPYATEPTEDNDWVKEGPHLMITVPDTALLEGLSTDPSDPIYVMWKDTPYAHIMVRIAEGE